MPRLITIPAGEAFGQPVLLLLVGAVFREGADRAEIAELHHVGAARTHRGGLLDGDDRVHQRAALAAVGLRDGDAEQALLAHQLGDIERKARIVRAATASLARCACAKRRTDSAKSFCSSVKSKFIRLPQQAWRHSAFMPDLRMISDHFVSSAAISAAYSSGLTGKRFARLQPQAAVSRPRSPAPYSKRH